MIKGYSRLSINMCLGCELLYIFRIGFTLLDQALGLEGVGLRELPPEISSAMAARLGMDNTWGNRPGAGPGLGRSPGKAGGAALGLGIVGALRQQHQAKGGASPPTRRTGVAGLSSGGRPPPKNGYQ